MAVEFKGQNDGADNSAPTKEPVKERPLEMGGDNPFVFAENTIYSGLMSDSLGSQDAEEYIKQLTKHYQNNNRYDVKLLNLNNETVGLAYSSIVVCLNDKRDESRVAIIPLLIAGTGPESVQLDEIPTNRMLSGDNSSPIIQVPSDAIDDRFYDVIHHYVEETYAGVNNVEFFSVDAIVLYSNIDTEDKDKTRSIAAIALNACAWELVVTSKEHTEPTIQQAMAMPNNMELSIDVHADRGSILNEVQKPIRRGFMIDMAIKDSSRNPNMSINQKFASRSLNHTIGFVDVTPIPQNLPNGLGGSATAIRYRPHVIIDSIVPRYYIPSYLFLAIANAMTLRSNNLWMHMVRPVENDELHDPGALNYLANLENNPNGAGEKIDFFSNDITAYDINSTLKQMFIDDIAFSIDIDVYGPQTWFTAMLAGVTGNNQEATNLVINTLNHMTNGIFGSKFSGQIMSNVTRIPTGTWEDKNGNVRDLREFDFIAVANMLGKENTRGIQEFAASSITMSSNSSAMASYLNTLKSIVPTAKIDSWVIRATFSTAFLSALESSFIECGYGANITSPTVIQGVSPLNSIGDFMSSAVMPQGDTGFARNTARVGGFNNYWSTPGSHRNW